ncbi:hypothetical protein GCM10010359_57850 [Streptomyces morookaense]|uniref:Uncharacterized protein n=1 Tax=Streptomyces morookaense TaxID=1970 RepID=A0A7Y7B5T7_STRMO|nr:hypothetical protein [Streptomyces morookaense]GHF48044.1 hypothetical protein GCM10010359_57850 [Streptomyces morookaense]
MRRDHSVSVHSEQLADVVAATVEVAAESGQAGAFTDEVAKALTSVVQKLAGKAFDAAEVRGFVSGWQEAVEVIQEKRTGTAGAQVYRMPSWGAGALEGEE